MNTEVSGPRVGGPKLTLPPTVRIYACTAQCKMRRQIRGLAALVEHQMGKDVRGGECHLSFASVRNASGSSNP